MPINLNPNVGNIESATGLAPLPDIGELSYNGADFSSLFTSKVTSRAVKSDDGRTIKYNEVTIHATGYVTLEEGQDTTDPTMADLRRLLDQQGGILTYQGKGMGDDLVVNSPGGDLFDVAWGPIPKVIDFMPLGGSRAAKVEWQVTTCIPEMKVAGGSKNLSPNAGTGPAQRPVVQFNEESEIGYDDLNYSLVTVRGTLEIALTWKNVNDRTLSQTVDDYRTRFLNLMATYSRLLRFRITRREFNVSRDKRTLQWSFAYEELPPRGMPPGAASARGTFSVRPEKPGAALMPWVCTLRGTYAIRKDFPSRFAWAAFVSLLQFRMNQSIYGSWPGIADGKAAGQNPQQAFDAAVADVKALDIGSFPLSKVGDVKEIEDMYIQSAKNQSVIFGIAKNIQAVNTIPISFSFEEGVYLDSKYTTFECTWRLLTTFDRILQATGIWRRTPTDQGRNWALSMLDVQGSTSWLANNIDAAGDLVIDLGVNP